MLNRAESRLTSLNGSYPENVILMQGHLDEMPFHRSSFETILAMHVLHVSENIDSLLSGFSRLLQKDGKFYATSTITTGSFRDSYLHFLHRIGEFAPPREFPGTDGGPLILNPSG